MNSTSILKNTTPIPASVKKADAIAVLQDHDFFLHCDPHLTGYEALPAPDPPVAIAAYKLPKGVTAAPGGPELAVKLYEVTDHVPNPVWDSNVKSTEEFVDFAAGLWVRIRSPMGVTMETTWYVVERAAGEGKEAGLDLVEDVVITCNRLLVTLVKGQVEANYAKIHEKIVKRMVEGA